MYEPSPFEDSRGLRLAADDDFMRSLDQLEDLLEEDLIAATAEHLKSKSETRTPPIQGSAAQGSAAQGSAAQGSAAQGSAAQGSASQKRASQRRAHQDSADGLNRFGGSILDAIPLAERLAECLESTDRSKASE